MHADCFTDGIYKTEQENQITLFYFMRRRQIKQKKERKIENH